MRNLLAAASLLACAAFPAFAAPEKPRAVAVVSTGQAVELSRRLTPEKPTVFVFLKPSSTLETAFLSELQAAAGPKVSVAAVHLKTGQEPVARQYEILQTPTALVFDRRGRLTGRSSDPAQIREAIRKAASVMRIAWAEEGDANFAESVKLLGRSPGTGILRTMTLKPEYLKYINDLSIKSHFSDGYLPRRVKEMIASYVSQLNKCKY